MSNQNIRKTSLEQAKTDFEEIRKFAQTQAEKKLQEEVDKKLLQIINEKLNEDVNISVDNEGNVEISKDGEELTKINTSDIESSDQESEEDFIEVSDDDEPINISKEEEIKNENMLEMDNMKMEQDAPVAAAPAPAPAETAPVAPAETAPVAPAETTPAAEETSTEEGTDTNIDALVSKMDTLINLMMQQQGVSNDQGSGQEFEVIDDEASAPAAPAVAPAEVPMQEELTFEIEQFEENEDLLEIMDDVTKEEIVTIVDEDVYEEDEEGLEETRGLGFTSKLTGDRNLKLTKMRDEKGHHTPVTAINENKLKAHYESKLGELTKENKGLNNELKDLKLERKEFEDAFVQLREQFDEMQTFNGKLALVNKLLMNGGLSFDQKIKVCEQFDSTDTIEEAQKLYKNIIKENNIKVGDVSQKIKASTTHTAKSSTDAKPLYESDEARRMKQLAGLSKKS